VVAQKEDSLAVIDERLGYPVVTGTNLRGTIARWLADVGTSRIALLCDGADPVVAFAERLRELVRGADRPIPVVLGERRKRMRTVEAVLDALAGAGVGRDWTIVGVGGGVAADLFGLAAALFMRGVPYVHVATTLVAMADAAIGGKTGVNLRAGKNLAGLFRNPAAVFCDVDALRTLPVRSVREGLAEIVKHALIDGDAFLRRLEELSTTAFERWPWVEIVGRSQQVKIAVVSRDALESGEREVLNLGHTFAHAIERASGYRISHGAAVALGLRAATMLAVRLGAAPQAFADRITALLQALGFPMHLRLTTEDVVEAMAADKKRRGGQVRFVVPAAPGSITTGVKVPVPVIVQVLTDLRAMPRSRR
jgi:3-dehydroquinate synthase